MICRRLFTAVLGAGVVVAGGFAACGCGGDEGQPGRGTISAPRKGGGMTEKPAVTTKPQAIPRGKAGGRGGAP